MPTQFEKVMQELREVKSLLRQTNAIIREVFEAGDDLFGDDPYTDEYKAEMRNQSGEDYNPGNVRPRADSYVASETRTHVEVRTLDGGVEMVAWEEVDPRIIEAVNTHKELRRRNPDIQLGPWQLYRDPQGMIRVSVDQAVLTELHKRETHQQPVPRTVDIPADMDVDQVAKEKE